MTTYSHADRLHRLVKQALDSGRAATIEEAEAIFRGYRVHFQLGGESITAADQVALLTGVALARRVFLGGVTVAGRLDTPLAMPLPLGDTLGAAVTALGGSPATDANDPSSPTISIGALPRKRRDGFSVRPVYAGWRGGVVPSDVDDAPSGQQVMPLAPMLAAALAVSEAFFYVRGETPAAGRRRTGLSLWCPDPTVDWLAPADEPPVELLPSNAWLIGLGHLGQAYLWALGLLPYPSRALHLVLQDIDVVTPSSESTSILTEPSMLGVPKTRAMATWAERRGFTTTIYERRFDDSFARQDSEPAIALCGLDNALGRRALDQVGFPLVVEVGLGRGYDDFRSLRLHTLPGSRTAAELWKLPSDGEDLTNRPAYQHLVRKGELDRCGVTLLAGKAIGAPFVGSVAATLAIAEILRFLHGASLSQMIDLDLQHIDHRTVVAQRRDFSGLNPGYVRAM